MMMMESDKAAAARHQKLLMDQCFNFTARRGTRTSLIQCYLEFICEKHLMTNVIKTFNLSAAVSSSPLLFILKLLSSREAA